LGSVFADKKFPKSLDTYAPMVYHRDIARGTLKRQVERRAIWRSKK